MADLLKHDHLKNATEADVIRITENNDKKRFTIEYLDDESTAGQKVAYIRANQGHSLKDVEVSMVEVKEGELLECVHGTYYRAWQSIKIEVSQLKR